MLKYWRPDDLAALDKEAEVEAGRSSQSSASKSRQAAPREPAARRSGRSPFLNGATGRTTGLRWVPKVAIQCTQGTSVPEAKEVDAELDFKLGPSDSIRPQDCEGLIE